MGLNIGTDKFVDEKGVFRVGIKGIAPHELVRDFPDFVSRLCDKFNARAVQFFTDAETPFFVPNEKGEYESANNGDELIPVGPLYVSGSRDPWEDEPIAGAEVPVPVELLYEEDDSVEN